MRVEARLLVGILVVGRGAPVVERRDKCVCDRGGPGCKLVEVCAAGYGCVIENCALQGDRVSRSKRADLDMHHAFLVVPVYCGRGGFLGSGGFVEKIRFIRDVHGSQVGLRVRNLEVIDNGVVGAPGFINQCVCWRSRCGYCGGSPHCVGEG